MNVRELLAAATPRPWREGTSSGAIVADELMPGEDGSGRTDVRSIAFYGGIIVGESLLKADRRLVVAAVNEYEALLDAMAALRQIVDEFPDHSLRDRGDYWSENFGRVQDVAVAALAKLDEVRGG